MTEDEDVSAQLSRDLTLYHAVESGNGETAWRCWQSPRPIVVIGRNSRASDEVAEEACRQDGIDVLRRFTGGGSVVLAPGCVIYSLVVSLAARPELHDVAASFRWVLGRIVEALGVPALSINGTDLAIGDRKVSGNSQRRGRRALLQHGTLLFDFDARLATRYLREPGRQPAYRRHRRHEAFLGNLPLSSAAIQQRLDACFRGMTAGQPSPPHSTPTDDRESGA